ncbi:MAG: DNA adenine methylase [Acidobacteriota bacterium]|nr:MAG: DNA adenine methylase [Acidobacteriota bacterium]
MITNPVLRYYGGKFRLARWIISHFPIHDSYVEPFGGGGSVLLQKPPSAIETYNDLDGDVCNFFLVVRDRVDELIRAIRLTPWSRDEFELCLHSAADPLERARRLYFRLKMSMHGGTRAIASNFRRHKSRSSPVTSIKPQALYEAAKRLSPVQIENRDALKLITEMDTPETLFYLDPPYVTSTRTDKRRYAHELDDDGHRQIGEVANNIKGFAVISGYACELYKEIFERRDWRRIDTESTVNGGVKRIESLWLSPRTAEAIG